MKTLAHFIFNLNSKKMLRSFFFSFIFFSCLFINGCLKITENELAAGNDLTNQNVDNNISNLKMSVHTNNSNSESRYEFKLPITHPNETFTAKFTNVGKDREVCLSVFYDYKQINIRTNHQDSYKENYIFYINNNEEASIDFYLEDLIPDNKYHKLLVCFTIGHNLHAKDTDTMSSDFGINTLYDLYYMENYNALEDLELPKDISMMTAKNVYHDFISASLMINMDYGSENIENQLVKYPPNLYRSSPDVPIKMMYNVSNETAENAIMILMIGYSQVKVDAKEYLFLDLKNAPNSVAKDSFEFMAPEKPGIYEVFGIIIYDPFEMTTIDSRGLIPEYSCRFTLEVTED